MAPASPSTSPFGIAGSATECASTSVVIRASATASDRAARWEKIPVAHHVMPNSSRLATTNCTSGLAQGRRSAVTRRSFPAQPPSARWSERDGATAHLPGVGGPEDEVIGAGEGRHPALHLERPAPSTGLVGAAGRDAAVVLELPAP